jgi:hypothetical protein
MQHILYPALFIEKLLVQRWVGVHELLTLFSLLTSLSHCF